MHIFLLAVVWCAFVTTESSASNGKKMVCYFGSWATYRPGAGKFDVESIDPMLCTHMVYGFAGLRGGEIASLDGWNERCTGYGKGNAILLVFVRMPKIKLSINLWSEQSY